jgi:hypothetical protein
MVDRVVLSADTVLTHPYVSTPSAWPLIAGAVALSVATKVNSVCG